MYLRVKNLEQKIETRLILHSANGLNTGMTEEDLVNVFRPGKRSDSPRPLLIQLSGYSYKNLVMESLYKLRHAETKFTKIIVAHDMTKTERAEAKDLLLKPNL